MYARTRSLLALSILLALPACQVATEAAAAAAVTGSESDLVARGDYVVRIGGCNDCHTPGYMDKQGEVDRAHWLTGNALGFNGPWGTTYPANLRLKAADKDEAAWLAYTADLHTRPMMPDFNVRAMSEGDRRAVYHLIRSLGAPGEPAPAYLPPGQEPPPPYVKLVLLAEADVGAVAAAAAPSNAEKATAP